MSGSFGYDKESIKSNEIQRINAHLEGGQWNNIEKVALTCRILYQAGHDSGLSGQITAKLEGDNYITQRLGLGFDEITVANLISIDKHLAVVSGTGMPNPANRFHSWIYAERPEIQCVVHTHPPYTSALSMIGQPLIVSHMDSCVLYEEVAFVPDWPGVPIGNSEGEIIANAIGKKKAVLLGHHGLVTVGSSVEEACVISLQIEKSAKLQMIAMAAGKIKPIDPALAREAHDWLSHPKRIEATFAYYARKIIRDSGEAKFL